MKFTTTAILSSLITTIPSSSAAASVRPPKELMQRKLLRTSLPEVEGQDWMTLENGVEFLPAADLSPIADMHMRRLTGDKTYKKVFADGTETYYDEYAQAWRALGFFIDCDASSNARRTLQQGGVDPDMSCQRMMLWAAYVDEKYQGNEGGEYMYYDRKTNTWDDRACGTSGNTRCVKMDCHLSGTHYSLLGFFKEPSYGDWMDQLFNNEGDCVWTDDEYKFMQMNRDVWPEQCTDTGLYDSAGSSIYYDIKPSRYGEFEIGLYNDTACIEAYQGKKTVLEVTKEMVCSMDNATHPCSSRHTNYHNALKYANSHNTGNSTFDSTGDIWELASSLEEWNFGFDVFKQCQPCKAYDLTTIVAGIDYVRSHDGSRYNYTSANAEGEVFQCNSNANVNQCMKFKANTQMLTASWFEVELAIEQGTIDDVPEVVSGFTPTIPFTKYGYGVSHQRRDTTALVFSWLFLMASATLLGASIRRYWAFRDEASEISEPLIASEKGVSA